MESLIRLISTPDRKESMQNEILDILDLTKLNNTQLLRISDRSKLTPEEFSVALTIDTDDQIVAVLQQLIPSLSLEDLKSIQFSNFSESVLQRCMAYMLLTDASTDKICVVLDKMKSVNYVINGTMNPLIHCCRYNELGLVKLLVERYNADIEHLSQNSTTAIMYSAQCGHVEVTKYLYDKGALLSAGTKHINQYATDEMKQLIAKWEAEKATSAMNQLIKDELDRILPDTANSTTAVDVGDKDSGSETILDQMKADYQKLKLENEEMKRNYETILNLLQNNPK